MAAPGEPSRAFKSLVTTKERRETRRKDADGTETIGIQDGAGASHGLNVMAPAF